MEFLPGAAPIPCPAQLSGRFAGSETTVHKDWLVAAAENSLDREWWAVLMPSGFVGSGRRLIGEASGSFILRLQA